MSLRTRKLAGMLNLFEDAGPDVGGRAAPGCDGIASPERGPLDHQADGVLRQRGPS